MNYEKSNCIHAQTEIKATTIIKRTHSLTSLLVCLTISIHRNENQYLDPGSKDQLFRAYVADTIFRSFSFPVFTLINKD